MIFWCQLSMGPVVQQWVAQQIIQLTTLACWGNSLSVYCDVTKIFYYSMLKIHYVHLI